MNDVVAVAAETLDTAALWRIRVFATCAELSLGSVELEAATSPSNSDTHKSATVACPEGKVVVGAGGAAMFNGKGDVILTTFYPNPGLTKVTAEASESVIDGGNWDVTAYAICAHRSLFDGLMLVTSALLPLPNRGTARRLSGPCRPTRSAPRT